MRTKLFALASTHIVPCARAIVGASGVRSTSRIVFGFPTVVLLRNSMTFAHIADS